MALGGHRNPVPVGKRSSVGGGLQAFRLKRPELAILPPLLVPPSESNNRRRRSSADDTGDSAKNMATSGPVIDRTDIIKLLSNSSSKKATSADRIHQLERTIVFLQEKHQELLAGLHQEVKSLKEKNRDLIYKLTLKQEGWIDSRPVTTARLQEARPGSASRSSLAQIKMLETQLAEAQTKLGEVVSRNQYLSNLLIDMKRYLKEDDVPSAAAGKLGALQESQSALGTGINSHSSLKVTAGGGSAANPVTPSASGHVSIEDAESIIRALERKNEDYRLEIIRLRAELMNALSENEKLSQDDQENGRWTRVEVRSIATGGGGGTHRSTPHHKGSDYHLPRISGSSGPVDSRQSTGHNSRGNKHD